MLTAQDVEQKTFSTALRGYDLDEVDDFLDEVVSTIRALNDQLEEAKSAPVAVPVPAPEPVAEEPEPVVETPEPAPEPGRQPVPERGLDESAVGRALIAAQTAADQLLAEAESEANRIVEGARQQADTWEIEKQAKKAEAQAEMADLAGRVRAVRSELALLAEQVSGNLDDMDEAIAASGVSDVGDDAGEGDNANKVTVLETRVDDTGAAEVETGSDDTDTSANGSDHLDQILTGVASDLQLSESDDDSEDHHRHLDRSEEEEDNEDEV